MFNQVINSPIAQVLIQVEAECLAAFSALVHELFGSQGNSATQYTERIERELRLGPAVCVLDAAERRMQRAG